MYYIINIHSIINIFNIYSSKLIPKSQFTIPNTSSLYSTVLNPISKPYTSTLLYLFCSKCLGIYE